MPAIPIKLRFGRLLSQSGSAGTRRLVIVGGILVVVALGSAMMLTQRRHTDAGSVIAKAPILDPLPGGPHTTPAYSELATQADQNRAAVAAAAQRSSVATMPGRETAVPNVDVLAAVEEKPKSAATPAAAATEAPPRHDPPTVRATTTTTAASTASTAATAAATTAKRQADDEKAKVYQAAIGSVLAGWGDKAQSTEVILLPDERVASGDTRSGRSDLPQTRQTQTPAGTDTTSYARRLGGRGASSSGQVLMPAGRGVYGRTILAASSDQGGPVVIEALSGPIAGDRMTGTFETRDTRMVVRLTSITLQDGTQQKINALVIAPDTLETSVASSVDQHYVTRFVLPVAAAFVSGLGQALAQSNSTVVAGPLGGATAFQRLNLSQQLGVAAGAAANQFGAAVTANAPKGPTVNLEANVNVGIMFLDPVYTGGEP